jgi:hypothetical protein
MICATASMSRRGSQNHDDGLLIQNVDMRPASVCQTLSSETLFGVSDIAMATTPLLQHTAQLLLWDQGEIPGEVSEVPIV